MSLCAYVNTYASGYDEILLYAHKLPVQCDKCGNKRTIHISLIPPYSIKLFTVFIPIQMDIAHMVVMMAQPTEGPNFCQTAVSDRRDSHAQFDISLKLLLSHD